VFVSLTRLKILQRRHSAVFVRRRMGIEGTMNSSQISRSQTSSARSRSEPRGLVAVELGRNGALSII
jgi:hypothetical protein